MSATTFREFPESAAANPVRREAGYNPPKMINGEFVYEVFVLGTRGAGKTSFLAAFYKQLATPELGGNNFYVDIKDSKQSKFLANTYEQLTNPNRDWPAGSSTVNEYEFHFYSIMKAKTLPLFRFQYLDYPGGYLTDEVDQADSLDFADRARNAHSILVLIDGQKVLQSIEGLSPTGGSLDRDLDTIIRKLMHCQNLPVHFVVTKWDILKSRDHTLERVRKELNKYSNFSNFLRSRETTSSSGVHLIPVSAVGDKFAVFDEDESRMKKLKNGAARPYNLELPVGWTIIDQLLLLQPKVAQYNIFSRLWAMILSMLTEGIRVAKIIPDDNIAMIAQLMDRTVGRRAAKAKQQIKAKLDKIKDQRSAISATIGSLAVQLQEFETKFPDSNLTRQGHG